MKIKINYLFFNLYLFLATRKYFNNMKRKSTPQMIYFDLNNMFLSLLCDIFSSNKISRNMDFSNESKFGNWLRQTRLDLCRIAMFITKEYLRQFLIKGCARMSVQKCGVTHKSFIP